MIRKALILNIIQNLMKKAGFLFAIVALVFSSCKKYEDGPAFSLRTKAERLSNTWIINSASEDGVDKTSDFNSFYAGYSLTINKGNTYSLSYRILNVTDYSESGTWVFNEKKTHVFFNGNSNNGSDWTILRLKEKELWGQFTDNSSSTPHVYELHMTPKF